MSCWFSPQNLHFIIASCYRDEYFLFAWLFFEVITANVQQVPVLGISITLATLLLAIKQEFTTAGSFSVRHTVCCTVQEIKDFCCIQLAVLSVILLLLYFLVTAKGRKEMIPLLNILGNTARACVHNHCFLKLEFIPLSFVLGQLLNPKNIICKYTGKRNAGLLLK